MGTLDNADTEGEQDESRRAEMMAWMPAVMGPEVDSRPTNSKFQLQNRQYSGASTYFAVFLGLLIDAPSLQSTASGST